ncbi:hypothetical protein V6N12_062519 [Hibiscus sabdariffa]|uniref:Uncharacterized protein n=1 Tax=Hibiscus sabdariffa TaxID=183260 RepID=A0ABR2F933_9ROSI
MPSLSSNSSLISSLVCSTPQSALQQLADTWGSCWYPYIGMGWALIRLKAKGLIDIDLYRTIERSYPCNVRVHRDARPRVGISDSGEKFSVEELSIKNRHLHRLKSSIVNRKVLKNNQKGGQWFPQAISMLKPHNCDRCSWVIVSGEFFMTLGSP